MSVMGSQLEIDLDPEGSETIVPRHTGQTGTGCFHLHDHSILETLDADRQGARKDAVQTKFKRTVLYTFMFLIKHNLLLKSLRSSM